MYENKICLIAIITAVFFMHGCCTTRGGATGEFDKNITELQTRIIELEDRNKYLGQEVDRLTSENQSYAEYYNQTTSAIGTNIDAAIESASSLDERIARLSEYNSELERILWQLTSTSSTARNKSIDTNQSSGSVVSNADTNDSGIYTQSIYNQVIVTNDSYTNINVVRPSYDDEEKEEDKDDDIKRP